MSVIIMDVKFLRVIWTSFVLLLLASQVVAAKREFGNASMLCIERERQALLAMIDSLGDRDEVISGADCCKWNRVSCDNRTGHVVELDLSDFGVGTINDSLVELNHLTYLDLSLNHFGGRHIPKFIGALTHLKYLSLFCGNFRGNIPHEFGNLTHLEQLELGENFLDGEIPASLCNLSRLLSLDVSRSFFTGKVPSCLGNLTKLQYLDLSVDYGEDPSDLPNKYLRSDLEWLSHLKFLKFIYLQNVDLSSAQNWLPQVAILSHLKELDFHHSNLQGSVSSSYSSVNISSTTLAVVILSYNNLTSSTVKSFLHLSNLETLDLSSNKLSGGIDEFIPTSKQLEILNLSSNKLTGSVPNLTQFPSLKELLLDFNSLNGKISESIGQLSKLEEFSVGHNSLQGVISETHFSKLSGLSSLDLSFNALMVNVSSDWVPPFQLEKLYLSSCKLGPHFPTWLRRTQETIHELDISYNNITDPIPDWFWSFWDHASSWRSLNLSHNQISGEIANLSLVHIELEEIDLSFNMLQGRIPSFLSKATRLDLSNNKFSEADLFICSNYDGRHLVFLDLSNNQLTGKLPECWKFGDLVFLSLANNNFSGNIPSSMGNLTNIAALHVGNNHFIGEIPLSLGNCEELRILDVAQNNLSGTVPRWIGDRLQKLHILSLRSNMFHGSLPSNICNLSELILLDVSSNDISGSIPSCLHKLTSLASQYDSNTTITYYYNEYTNHNMTRFLVRSKYSDSVSLIWKGKEVEYQKTLGLMRSIDLSSNNLIGKIPNDLMNLTGLVSLNLSRNKLSGEIPPIIGQLKSLDSLDLSRNQFFGRIPSQFSQLGFLGVLDLSYNNLSGEIPYITKLLGFDASTYMGNPELCGPPLAKCPMQQIDPHDAHDKDEKHFISIFYICMIGGFIVGFWGVCGSLILKKSWRYAYFKFFDNLYNKLYVLSAINMANLQKRIRAIMQRSE